MRIIGFLMMLSGLLASANAGANVPVNLPTQWEGRGFQLFPTPEAAVLFSAQTTFPFPFWIVTLESCGAPTPIGFAEFGVSCTVVVSSGPANVPGPPARFMFFLM